MKKTLKFSMLSLGVIAGGLLSSCSVDEGPNNPATNGMLAKAPKILAYSGNTYFTPGTRGHDVNVNMWGGEGYWDCPSGPDLTPEDIAAIKKLLEKGEPTTNDVILPFENYFVEQVYKGESQYYSKDRCEQPGCDHINYDISKVTGSDQMEELFAYNSDVTNKNYGGYNDPDNNYAWVEVITEDHNEHINNFNHGTNTNKPSACVNGHQHNGTTLMTGMKYDGVTANNQFGFKETLGTDPKVYNNYIIVEYNGYWYVGFDYEMHKNNQTTHNHNEEMDVERDWNFTDWIVRITPAYHYGETPKENPGGVTGNSDDTDVQDNCPKCGDPNDHHDENGNCTDCEERGNGECFHNPEENPGQDEDDTPEVVNPAVPGDHHNNEVEINLNGSDKEGNYLESHLSIHVRYPGDVEVFIPVPKQYYCDKDDMEIVMKHEDNHMIHGGPTELEYQLKDSDLTVKLTVAYEDGGIRITTHGITQEVIDWCAEKCHGDGITFEVWNYFNDTLTLDELKGYLNQATVEFLGSENDRNVRPDYYINAFTEENGEKNPDDCDVSIIDSQKDSYDNMGEGPHLNGSTKNDIYKNKNATSEDEHNN